MSSEQGFCGSPCESGGLPRATAVPLTRGNAPDGTQYSPDAVKVRYPAPFFGLHRCVFVIWTPTAVEFQLGSGDACTDFLG